MKNIILVIMTLNITQLYCQKNITEFDSIYVYQKINHGGTTAKIRSNFLELELNNNLKRKMQNTDLKNFNDILTSKKSKKLFQQKYGGENYYLLNFENGKKNYFIIGWNNDFLILDNLTKMRRWIFNNSEKESIKAIIERYCR